MKEMFKVKMQWFDNSCSVSTSHWVKQWKLFDAESAEDLQEQIDKFIVDKESCRFKHVKFIDAIRI